jgi:O-antigen ligase
MTTAWMAQPYTWGTGRPGVPSIHAAARLFGAAVLLISGLVDLPQAISLGAVTSQAALTILYFCAATVLLTLTPVCGRPVPLTTLPLLMFWLWAATSLAWAPVVRNGIQNVLAIGTIIVMLLLAEAATSSEPSFAFGIEKQLKYGLFLAVMIYAGSVLWSGAGTSDVIAARSFGLFAVFGVAHYLAKWRYKSRSGLLFAIAITVLIGISQSRLALGIAVVLFPLSQFPSRNPLRVLRMLLVSGVIVACSYGAFMYFDSLRERFLSGDLSLRIGSIAINGSGRTAFWKVTLESYEDSPLVGKGAGSAEALIDSFFVDINHPHNDYLRIAHDYGAIGLAIWSVGVLSLLVKLWRSWRWAEGVDRNMARLQLTALLALVGFALEMTMENAMVYIFVGAPLGLIVGSALGVRRAAIARISG